MVSCNRLSRGQGETGGPFRRSNWLATLGLSGQVHTVKTFRVLALLGVATGVIAFQTRLLPIFAAGSPGTTGAQSAAPVPDAASAAGAKVFVSNCAMCHGENLQGHPPTFPSLAGVGKTMTSDQIKQLIRQGRRMMPAFPSDRLSAAGLDNLLAYLTKNTTFMPSANPAEAPPSAPIVAMNPGPHTPPGPGASVYLQNCAFCHGRDAGGGESGPDLTRSKLVAEDVNGSTIESVVRNGRAEGKMPKFNFSDSEMSQLVAFIHAEARRAAEHPGGRRGVDVADLQTGNVDAGKAYFNGSGGCFKCHSPSGDLAGIASRYQGLQLEEQMLYPRDAKDAISVTLPSGETVKGVLAYQDEFTVGLRDANGVYRSWPTNAIKFTIDSPVTAHVDQFPKYTDDDIHNLMAYIQTLK
jgi:cytochrome c oxidase cbb3-type subunit III